MQSPPLVALFDFYNLVGFGELSLKSSAVMSASIELSFTIYTRRARDRKCTTLVHICQYQLIWDSNKSWSRGSIR